MKNSVPNKNNLRDLVLIHGWGFGRGVWNSFIPYLEDRWRITCVDLPGYGKKEKSVSADIDQIVNNMEADIPENSVLFAWSLGGLIATKLAEVRKDIEALVLVAHSPTLLNKMDWQHGISAVDFNELEKYLSINKTKAMQKFARLVAMGDKNSRKTISTLEESSGESPESETLKQGLDILRQTDLREMLAKQQRPTGMIFGENDVLVKYSTGKALREIRPDIQVIKIAEAGHAPFVSRPRETADALMKLTANLC